MSNLAGVMYALAVILTFLAVVAVLLRFYARRIKKATIACDDYLIFLALVSCPGPYASWTDVQLGIHRRNRHLHGDW